MPFDARGKWIPEDDSSVTRLTGMLSSNSPLMQQARAAGTAGANARGLVNSSIAVGAAQGEAIKAASPFALQDSNNIAARNNIVAQGAEARDLQTAQDAGALTRLNRQGELDTAGRTQQGEINANLSRQEAQAEMARLQTQLASTEGQQRLEIQSRMDQLREQIAGNLSVQGAQDTAALERLNVQGTQQIAIQNLTDAAAMARQKEVSNTQMTMQERDNASVLLRQLSAQGHQLTLQDRTDAAALVRQLSAQDTQLTLQQREAVAAMKRVLAQNEGSLALQTASDTGALTRQREQIAGNLTLQGAQDTAALERQRDANSSSERLGLLQAQTSLTNNQSNNQVSLTNAYFNAFSALAQNQNLPANVRDAYIVHFNQVLDASRGLASSITTIPISWGGTTPPPASGAGTTTPPPADGGVTPAPTPPATTPPVTTPPVTTPAPAPADGGPVANAQGQYPASQMVYRDGKFYHPVTGAPVAVYDDYSQAAPAPAPPPPPAAPEPTIQEQQPTITPLPRVDTSGETQAPGIPAFDTQESMDAREERRRQLIASGLLGQAA